MKFRQNQRKSKLPRDIRQLVDKGNFVIAIKTLSERENISLDDAKQRIDQYEAERQGENDNNQEQKLDQLRQTPLSNNTLQEQGFSKLTSSVTHAIESEGVSAKVTPKWLLLIKRILFILVLAYLFVTILEKIF